ncbi:Procollagen lysyl hydroxylase [Strongyloides ratti]|uniref:procollagen-lysine 5-dioxygenase n=1 Tax=Strongyloides ratti TaxID=34506 RepID=A0A090LTW8_STRRB|nr:Procollagen lysyl hydroxylase [Strongyloides ratti]CEF71662.1 Procollagen lysyl hydroxylase [Strongyloides ratti]
MTDGLIRLIESATTFNITLNIIGLGEKWEGGNMEIGEGGGHKIHLFKNEMEKYKDRDDLVVVFMDAYDVLFTSSSNKILISFLYEYKDNRVLFSAEGFCWPDKSLVTKYPLVKFGKRFLNSGLYMGYANDIYEILNYGKDIKNIDDDQLFFTKIYLDESLRNKHKITLDSMSFIFQNLNGVKEDIYIEYNDDGKALINNIIYNTHPILIHGNGPSKIHLNSLSNYIPEKQSNKDGCLYCKELTLNNQEIFLPSLSVGLFIYKPIPFIEEFLQSFANILYDKNLIDLLIFNNQDYNENDITKFINKYKKDYKSITVINEDYTKNERDVRDESIKWALELENDYLFMLDGDVHITNRNILKDLIYKSEKKNYGILSPLMTQIGKLFSNFWGAINNDGYYARSENYMGIVNYEYIGVWNVPFISSAILIKKNYLNKISKAFSGYKNLDPDMSFCAYLRDKGIFMYIVNTEKYGFLVESDDFKTYGERKHPELYTIFSNRKLWEKRYVHPEYYQYLKPDIEVPQPCNDVYDYPLVSERFCSDLIEEMEYFGEWSNGGHEDKRLQGGYENVPTRDIHMNQIEFEKQWLYFLDEFVRPMQEKVFIGYYHVPIESNMMFVVRYRPDEQPSLRPHHDASTFSIDIALNKAGVDYEGGGVRYIRQNCTVHADQVGWTMMFPGRLTHMHEGLPTTKGTRYILVSFINP